MTNVMGLTPYIKSTLFANDAISNNSQTYRLHIVYCLGIIRNMILVKNHINRINYIALRICNAG